MCWEPLSGRRTVLGFLLGLSIEADTRVAII
jgi:hypothetical protein